MFIHFYEFFSSFSIFLKKPKKINGSFDTKKKLFFGKVFENFYLLFMYFSVNKNSVFQTVQFYQMLLSNGLAVFRTIYFICKMELNCVLLLIYHFLKISSVSMQTISNFQIFRFSGK